MKNDASVQVKPFSAQFLVEVPVPADPAQHMSNTGTATGSDHEAGDNDKD